MAGVWKKTLLYLGLVEEDELDEYEYDDLEPEEPERRAPVRRISEADARSPRREAVVRAMPSAAPSARFHVVHPTQYRDEQEAFEIYAKEIGERFRDGYSVFINFDGVEPRLRRRGFCFEIWKKVVSPTRCRGEAKSFGRSSIP